MGRHQAPTKPTDYADEFVAAKDSENSGQKLLEEIRNAERIAGNDKDQLSAFSKRLEEKGILQGITITDIDSGSYEDNLGDQSAVRIKKDGKDYTAQIGNDGKLTYNQGDDNNREIVTIDTKNGNRTLSRKTENGLTTETRRIDNTLAESTETVGQGDDVTTINYKYNGAGQDKFPVEFSNDRGKFTSTDGKIFVNANNPNDKVMDPKFDGQGNFSYAKLNPDGSMQPQTIDRNGTLHHGDSRGVVVNDPTATLRPGDPISRPDNVVPYSRPELRQQWDLNLTQKPGEGPYQALERQYGSKLNPEEVDKLAVGIRDSGKWKDGDGNVLTNEALKVAIEKDPDLLNILNKISQP